MEQNHELEIDPKAISPGTCFVNTSLGEKIAVCKSDDGKIRIFRVIKEAN